MIRTSGLGRSVAVAVIAAGALLIAAAPAHAELNGPCEATGTFTEGTDGGGPFTVDPRAVGSETVTVPRSDSVEWAGSVPEPPGAYSGSVVVDLPPPFGTVEIDSWAGTSETTSNRGVQEYDLPALVPSGVKLRVSGEHIDAANSCDGFVNAEIEGGPFTAPAVPIAALALTAVAAAGFVGAIKPIFRRAS